MQLLSVQKFAGAANQEFEISVGEAAMTVTLIEVKPLQRHAFPGMLREPFSLLFKSASPVILPQKMYRMQNPTVGSLSMFLVPVAQDGGAIVYEAVFN
ncbi:DUF6916 family protein [Sphingomonas sp. M1-B02]|uniref:DUF6916 family protein n=1 Tax=Sphingomonas sp. M1-B02 TaxID=3114300 RepID=UPI0022400E7E|nr:hypothetical protein [Sphingomonas sp. S6-11]UZK66217.1 hypothetical protein OKW87_17205 [Sphingomonas sp. S6-11]